MGKPILYHLDLSPPVRAVLLTAAAIDLELELKNVNLLGGELLSEEFRKLNPQHTIPTLDDNGAVIWDSHAICTYLVSKYGKDDSLYPKDLLVRAKVDQRLHFDTGILFPSLRAITELILFRGQSSIPEENIKKVESGYNFLESFLQNGDQYLVGNQLTVADFCCIATITSLPGIVPHDKAKYPKMVEWINSMKTLAYYEKNGCGADKLVKVIADKIAKEVNLTTGDHLTEEFLKLNPQHTIPTLDDNGAVIWDSHAICAYLVSKYGKDDSLYPKDLLVRAKVDQRLHFDTGILFARLRNLYEPILFFNSPELPNEKVEAIKKAYEFVEVFLKDDDYLVGNHLTVADFCCVATITSLSGVAPHDKQKYPKMIEWINRLKKLPYYADKNEKGAEDLVKFVNDKLVANRAAVK